MSLATLIPLLVKFSIMLMVFAIGLKATFYDAFCLFRRPGQLARALFAMNVLMPLFALLLAFTFPLHTAVKLALFALSVSPLPPFLPKTALKAGGREDYTIGLLAGSAILSVVLIPVTMEVVGWIAGLPLQMTAMQVALLAFSSVLIPLLVGIAVRHLSSSFAERAAKPITIVALIMLIIPCIPILFTSVRAILTLIGDGTLLALAAFALVGFIIGHLLGGPEPENRSVLALATASRHPAVALAISHHNFPGQKLAGALVLVYLVLSAILGKTYLSWAKKSQAAEATSEKQVEA